MSRVKANQKLQDDLADKYRGFRPESLRAKQVDSLSVAQEAFRKTEERIITAREEDMLKQEPYRVQNDLQSLHDALSRFEDLMSKAEAVLEPVLTPADNDAEEEDGEEPAKLIDRCSLGIGLYKAQARLVFIEARIKNLLRRIQI